MFMPSNLNQYQLFNKGSMLMGAGKFAEAYELFVAYINESKGKKTDLLQVMALKNAGVCCKEQADIISNIGVIHKNQALMHLKNNQSNKAKEELNTAEEYLKKAKQLDFETGNKQGIAHDLLNLGILYRHMKNRSKAFGAYEECIKVARDIDNKQALGNAKSAIGDIYRDMKEYDKAIQYFHDAIADFIQTGDDQLWSIAVAESKLGFTYFDKGDKENARKTLLKAAKLFSHMGINDTMTQKVHDYLKRC